MDGSGRVSWLNCHVRYYSNQDCVFPISSFMPDWSSLALYPMRTLASEPSRAEHQQQRRTRAA